MSFLRIAPFILAAGSAFAAQGNAAAGTTQLPSRATIPITFIQTVNAAHAKPGDVVLAKTIQSVHLTDGGEVPAGSIVKGHVLTAKSFVYDKTHYAKQVPGVLDIQFDSLEMHGQEVPLKVSVRAMADPISTWQAYEPEQTSDVDPQHSTVQVGGDLLSPYQSEILNRNGDVVGYNKKGGAYAHLIANSRGSVNCDGGDTEQPVSLFSASACGLYGFADVVLTNSDPSRFALASTHRAPEIWKHSTALLETTPNDATGK